MEDDDLTFAPPILIINQTTCVIPRKQMNIVISLHKSDGQKVETKALIDSGAAGLFID